MSCGERFWIKLEAPAKTVDSRESNPIHSRAEDMAQKRAKTEEPYPVGWVGSVSAKN